MPWNEPGGNNQDPWSGGGRNQGPPDLDEAFRKLWNRLRGMLGMRPARGGGGGATGTSVVVVVVVLAVLWLASGIYIVGPGEKAVVFRFGAFKDVTDPGPHWHLPWPIEHREVVNFTQVRDSQHRSMLLTQDENIIDIELAVQYRVKDARDYLINVRGPDITLRDVVDSVISEVVGQNTMDFILGDGRSVVATESRVKIQKLLDSYGTGIEVLSVNLQQAQPPEAVQSAFADAIKAREDEARFRNEAEAYANGILPLARGEAARIEQEATAYKEKIIAMAEGDASRFTQLVKAYRKAPEITRKRLYIETMEAVLGDVSKVLVDIKNGNNLMYLPLDKVMQGGAAAMPRQSGALDNTLQSSKSISRSTLGNRGDGMRSSSRSTLREARP
ncbi:MAG: FtsH protease activity modulator HflK [Gammaproteobacteria bacterium]|nr:MAG: FtsH protease activity modulator HflK [Gammaproteobacteria bacterium]